MTVKLFRIVFTALFTCIVTSLSAQTITGNVKDSSGEPILGATIMETGTKNGTVTDIDGNFTIKLQSAGNLNVSYIGMKSQVVKTAGKTTINVTLQDDNTTLNEIVVVGYGTMKKSDLTGSVSTVGTEKLNEKGAPGLMESLQGATPGVNITQNSGRTGGGYNIEIRGKSSINSGTTPLFVVDGVMCDDIDWLNPQDIDRIDVLKDASSTAIYGSRATAGVVMVTTKGSLNIKKQEKATISYDGYYGWTKTARMPEFMDGNQFTQYRLLKFLSPISANNNILISPSSPLYGSSNLEQCLIWDGQDYVMNKMVREGTTYDWPSLVTKNGSQQNHYLAVSGSTEKVNYHMGLGYNGQDGIYKDDKQNRINFKGSLDAKVNKFVTAGFNFTMARQENTYADDNAVKAAYRMNPFMVPYFNEETARQYNELTGSTYEAGDLAPFPGNKYALGSAATGNQFTDTYNPIMSQMNSTKQRETWRVLGNVYLKFDFTKDLNFKTTFSPNYNYYREGYYEGYENTKYAGHTYAVTDKSPYVDVPISFAEDAQTWSKAYYNTSRSFDWTWDNIINYNHTFNKIHSLGVMGLFSMQQFNREKSYWAGTNTKLMGVDWYAMQNLAHNADESYTEYTENSMISYALRANYGYKDRYLLTATVRWDGSSKFSDGDKWGAFPSVAAAWRISEENFMKKIDWVSNLKLRLAYGVTGNNTGIKDYDTQASVVRKGTYFLDGKPVTGYAPSGIVNKVLKWETSHEFNVGLDFGFLRNRISGSIDWYTKKSEDLLYQVSLPLEAGVNSDGKAITMTTNVGSVRNTGVEIALTGVVVDTKDWNWTLSANFAANKNKVLEINGISDQIIPTSNAVTNSLFVGESYSAIYGYETQGIVSDRQMIVPDLKIATDNGFTPGESVRECDYYYKVYGIMEGQPMIVDRDNNGKIDSEDKRLFRGDPKWSGNITSNLSYKGFDLGVSLYAKVGQYSYSPFYSEYTNFADRGKSKLEMDYYIPAGTLISCEGVNPDGTYINPVFQETTHYGEFPFPNDGSSNNGVGPMKTYWDEAKCIVKSSFAKIKNITLGYTFPKSWLKPWGCQHLRLYFTVTNPFVFTDYKGFDPEWAGSKLENDGPSTVTYQIGASIKF